jgi:hypothetical protein
MGSSTDQYQQEAEDDEYNKREVNDEYRIRQDAVQVRAHDRPLTDLCGQFRGQFTRFPCANGQLD